MMKTTLTVFAVIAILLFTGASAFAQAPAPAPATVEDEVKALSEVVIGLKGEVKKLWGARGAINKRLDEQSKAHGTLAARLGDAEKGVVEAKDAAGSAAAAVRAYLAGRQDGAPLPASAPDTKARDAQVGALLQQAAGLLSQGAKLLEK